ncbi:MAG TPA: hypothetical protein VHH92_07875 [Actinomycetota bacterium]|nr:hypothetical protein [Actinomycetota bacterium]
MIAQISLSNQPCCEFINNVPQWFFLLVHIVIFLFALVFGIRAFGAGEPGFGWGFTLFALAEVSYLTYHVNLTLFLLAHTISEVFVLLGILLIAGSAARKGLYGRTGRREPDRAIR